MPDTNTPIVKTQTIPEVPQEQKNQQNPSSEQLDVEGTSEEKKIEVEDEKEKKMEQKNETQDIQQNTKDQTKDTDLPSKAMGTGMQASFLIVCLIIALIKDIIEIILVLTGVGNIIVIFISVPFTIILALLLGFAGRRSNFNSAKGAWQSIVWILSYVADDIPVVCIIPISTIMVIVAFASKKDSKKIKKLEQTASKIQNMPGKIEKTKETIGKAKGFLSKFVSKI